MVEVTRHNFEEKFNLIKQAISESSFIAIDTEFTGLDLGATKEFSLFDDLQTRYEKLKDRASAFLPCQIGLSMFKRDKKENKYLVETYIFYIRPYLCGSTDRRFMCQASSLDFLCGYDFDFNKFIKEGIPYLNEDEITQLHNEIKDGSVAHSHEKLMEFKSKREIDMLINNTFFKSELNSEPPLQMNKNNVKKKEAKKLIITKDKTVHAFFQVNELRNKYPSLWVYHEEDKIIVENCFPDKSLIEACKKLEKESLIDYHIGFTKVFRILKSSKKAIVGHNLLMDLMLFYQNFYKTLPKTFKEFKKELHSVFPVVFDTRHIWLHIKKFCKLRNIPRRSGLFDLLETFKNPTDSLCALYSPAIECINCNKYDSDQFPHESGYDSYITGWIFLKICHVLALSKIKNHILIQPQSLKQHITAVAPFENKINLSYSSIRYIDLVGDEPISMSLLHLKVKNKNKDLNLRQLSSLLEKYEMVEFKINENKREAILAVGTVRSHRDILKDFQNGPDFVVSQYSVFFHSTTVKTAFWLTSLGFCSIAAFYAVKLWSRF